eukprot:746052-Hanusia_phi.AAC.1
MADSVTWREGEEERGRGGSGCMRCMGLQDRKTRGRCIANIENRELETNPVVFKETAENREG